MGDIRIGPASNTRRITRAAMALATLAALAACSPGTLPSAPSPVLSAGGGGRYNGTITYRRLAGPYTITEGAQTLSLSVTLRESDQINGRFESAASSGSIHGIISGTLANGTFEATAMVTSIAQNGGATVSCEGRAQVSGTLSDAALTWTSSTISYDNCPGLMTTSQAQAVAVSPIPGALPGLAALTVSVLGGTSVSLGACGVAGGYPFTVEIAESAGVRVTFDTRFAVEERRNFGALSSSELDMPFTNLAGGERRRYSGCSASAGTYQAFFSGTDANGNRFRVSSPIVTFLP